MAEEVTLTNMCMIKDKDNNVVVQHRNSKSWPGTVFPGGHVEAEESIVLSVIREVKEETGLNIKNPTLCGVKQFKKANGTRYIVFLFTATEYDGNLTSSAEGDVEWVAYDKLKELDLASGFEEMLPVFEGKYQEMQYVDNGETLYF